MTIDPVSVRHIYDDLAGAVRLLPDLHRAYSRIHQVFGFAVNLAVERSQVNFSGTFARVDFLLKEHQASPELARMVNDCRVRLRQRLTAPVESLRQYFFYDLKATALFVALLSHIQPPEALMAYFPSDEAKARPLRALDAMYIRALVERVGEEYIYCRADDFRPESLLKVSYRSGRGDSGYDWSYLQSLLSAGVQINIVRPRADGDVIYPELIIVDPDQLVNVSTVASCFTNYAESYLVDLIKRLQAYHDTHHTILGNFASQLLDEAIHGSDNTYADSIREFFRGNALKMIGADIDSSTFHSQARAQKANIDAAIKTALPWTLHSFEPKDGVVEPSFISEMLGLQGRMDFLQLDFKVLFEQKSGGAANNKGDFLRPIKKEDHYVQMLLYMAVIRYNFHEIYQANSRELHAFLLYSKYRQSLLGLSMAPDLIFRAFKVRNELAWANNMYASKGMRMLESMTAQDFNLKDDRSNLWSMYQLPQIEAVLQPIHSASALEREYYFRFLRFISSEYMISKVGTPHRPGAGFASTWLDSLDEKRATGSIFDSLSLVMPQPDAKVSSVSLHFHDSECCEMANFRKGDIVILYPYLSDQEPDARRNIVIRCIIESIMPDTISLALRAPQSDARMFVKYKDYSWAIEHDFMETSHSALFRGMHAFLSAPQSRRDLLMMRREPQVDTTVKLKGDYGDFNDLMLRVKQAHDFFLIIGPPGTGKTSFGMLNTLKEQLLEPDTAVMLASYTNRAVDEICSKLVEEGIDFLRLGNAMSCDPLYVKYLLSTKVTDIPTLDGIKAMISNTRVVVGTTSSFNSNLHIFSLRSFSLAIIDEASQILEPHLMGILSAVHGSQPAVAKVVFIGDHKQLPAVVQQQRYVSQVEEPMLHDIGLYDCRLSLFERLLSRYESRPEVTYMLRRQGRMHSEISDFPSQMFYAGSLDVVPLPHQTSPLHSACSDPVLERRVVFVDVPSPTDSPSDKVNLEEAEVIARMVVDIYHEAGVDFDPNVTIGVIVPYRNQIAAVRSAIDRHGVAVLHDITIDTVERFQGSQRDNIIYGFTVQRFYQLDFLTDSRFIDSAGALIDRKLNVAMTRARKRLVLVGARDLLATDSLFCSLIDTFS